jgi:hypothetical protein
MHPPHLSKKEEQEEEEVAEYVEMRQDKMRRSEAGGEEFKLAPFFKINVLRMLMTGRTKEHVDLCEASRDTTNAAKSYEGILCEAKTTRGGASWIVQQRRRCNREAIPWTLELSEAGVGTTTSAEDTIKKVCCWLQRQISAQRQKQIRMLQLRLAEPFLKGVPLPATKNEK